MSPQPFAQVFSKLTTPKKIQEYLDTLEYSDEERYRCPLNVLKDQKAHCFDGALFGAAALRNLGYLPLLVELIPNEHDDDHILAVFRHSKYWGAVAKSSFVGLRYREPVYQNLRELVMSYFESYFNVKGELINFKSDDRYWSKDGKTVRRYQWSTPVREYRDFNGRN